MEPISIACRHVDEEGKNCGAEAGQKCNWPHPWAEMMGFHAERIEDAAAFMKPADHVEEVK